VRVYGSVHGNVVVFLAVWVERLVATVVLSLLSVVTVVTVVVVDSTGTVVSSWF